MKVKIEKLMQNTFSKSMRITDSASIICFFVCFMGIPLSLLMWNVTGISFFSHAGRISFVLALGAICTALAGQSLKIILYAIARMTGKRTDFFEPEKPIVEKYAPQIKRAINLLKRFQPIKNHDFRPQTNCIAVNNRLAHHNTRTNARAYRSHSRPSFSRASSSSGENSSGDGDSGSGDDPPRYKHSLKPLIYSRNKLNSKSNPWHGHDSCLVGRCLHFEGRRYV